MTVLRKGPGPGGRDIRVLVGLALTVAFILAVMADRQPAAARLALYAAAPVAAAVGLLAPRGRLARWTLRSLGFLPFLAVVILLRPLSSSGLAGSLRLLARGWACAAALCVFGTVHDFHAVTAALGRAGIGGIVLDVVTLAYRYLGTIGSEARRLETARNARYFGGRWASQPAVLGNMMGSLLVRSFERGERVYAAMVSRGYNAGWDRVGHEPAPAPVPAPAPAPAPPGWGPALRVSGLEGGYPGRRKVLRGVSLTVMPGGKMGIIGLSGVGKTTLLLCIAGLLRPDSGAVEIMGWNIWPGAERDRRLARKEVGFVFQSPDDQLFMPTVAEDVSFGPANLGLPVGEVTRRVSEALSAVDATGYEPRLTYHLSAGEKKRVALATVLSMKPRLLLLDEPTGDLDPRRRREIASIIARTPAAMLIATHDLDLVRECCDSVAVLADGLVAAWGPAARILDDQALLASFGLA